MFLKISLNSQENACARVSFLIKLHATVLHIAVTNTVHAKYLIYNAAKASWKHIKITERKLCSQEIHLIRSFTKHKSSRSQVFYKVDVLIYFAKFTGKNLCWSLFFNKVAGLRPATLLIAPALMVTFKKLAKCYANVNTLKPGCLIVWGKGITILLLTANKIVPVLLKEHFAAGSIYLSKEFDPGKLPAEIKIYCCGKN